MQAHAIRATLETLRPALNQIAGPWWVIGSAALVLHGVDRVVALDIDLMLSADDAARLVRCGGFVPLPRVANDRFFSEVYARRDDLPMPVEVMGGFSVRSPDGLQPVRIGPPLLCDGWPIAPLPALIAMLRVFGRAKDQVRLDLVTGR